MTLEEYLRDNVSRDVIDFRIRASVGPDGPTFYIHPLGKDGLTLDFEVSDNILIPKVGS